MLTGSLVELKKKSGRQVRVSKKEVMPMMLSTMRKPLFSKSPKKKPGSPFTRLAKSFSATLKPWKKTRVTAAW